MQQDEIKQNTKNTFIYLQKKTKRKQLEDNEWMKPKTKKQKSNTNMKFKHVNNYIKFYKQNTSLETQTIKWDLKSKQDSTMLTSEK